MRCGMIQVDLNILIALRTEYLFWFKIIFIFEFLKENLEELISFYVPNRFCREESY